MKVRDCMMSLHIYIYKISNGYGIRSDLRGKILAMIDSRSCAAPWSIGPGSQKTGIAADGKEIASEHRLA